MGKKQQHTGHLGDCSQEQLAALLSFRNEVVKMGFDTSKFDDYYLLRFLRARKFDLCKTLEMFKDSMNWRQSVNIEAIKRFEYKELNEVKKCYPHGYFRTDKEGRPIYIERVGLIKFKEMLEVTDLERYRKYFIQQYEHILDVKFPACSKAKGKRVDSTIYIMDLKGGALKLCTGKIQEFIKSCMKIGQGNYPEMLYKMFIINAPLMFYGIWNMIKPFIEERTKVKISILGSNYKKELLEIIDEHNLPDFLGGKATVAEYGENLSNEEGPWTEYQKLINWPYGIPDNKKEQEAPVEVINETSIEIIQEVKISQLADTTLEQDNSTASNSSSTGNSMTSMVSFEVKTLNHSVSARIEAAILGDEANVQDPWDVPGHYESVTHRATEIKLFHTKSMPARFTIEEVQ